MASTNPVNDVFGFTPTTSTSKTSSTNGIGKDTFMKLLVAQMSQQNPLEPTDDKEMIAQMTQFSTLEQITNMATESSKSATASQMSQAVNLLGRTVTYLDADGAKQTGTVDQVSMANGAPNLTIGGKDGITTSQITQVR
jgi:flagellar basal-body rod modification protein FlgD